MPNVPLRTALGLIAVVAATMVVTTVLLSITGGYLVVGGMNDVARTTTTVAGTNTDPVVTVEQRGNGSALQVASAAGVGAHVSGGSDPSGGDAADLVLGGAGRAPVGEIASDPTLRSSDLRLTSNDDVIVRLDRDRNEDSRFVVVDPRGSPVFSVAKDAIAGSRTFRADESGVATFVRTDPAVAPGDLLIVHADGSIGRSTAAAQTAIVGVAAPRVGVVVGAGSGGRTRLALAGLVPVKATLEGGTIAPGDFLTSSSTAGHAMKATPVIISGVPFHRPGTIVGRAMSSVDPRTGTVLVLIDLG